MSERDLARSSPCVDRMSANLPGERTGSRPKPPKAGARSASLEPGRTPGDPSSSQLLTPPSPGKQGEGASCGSDQGNA